MTIAEKWNIAVDSKVSLLSVTGCHGCVHTAGQIGADRHVALEPETFTVTAITEGWQRAARTEVTRKPGA